MKNKITAWLLAILLWSIGAHKFYLWKWIQWIIYLLFCATWIPAILWILEWIIYLVNWENWFDINYNIDYITKQEYLNKLKQKWL